ncbi:hypothetical protein [Hoylesella nanceiensis]|jgi:hypothetical protein|uniref:hypothetical protein n=1 Tax=Hoylesella nanceiensis TaxID=425941 RepID=UPI0027B8917C|nr:hypothetical protein [Hoylesella nanceiensis]
MGSDFSLYIIAIIALVVAVVVVKKITGCLIKSVLLLGIIGLLLYLYFMVYQH